jgi:glycosyltransferase involved in cell wall biosynthesis
MDAEMTRLAVPGKMVKTIPNGVDTKYFQKKNEASLSESPTILFTAGFGYHPNIEAVEWFLDKVFLGLLSIIPNCKFLFAGSEAESVYQNIKSTRSSIDQSVECISDPPDIRPCFEKAWVYVVPLQYGGGTRLKILEAMSMRVPVVSTRIGAEGVPYEDGKHLLLADSPEDFIKAIVKLLNDPTLRTDMSANAAEFVGENYDWQRLCQQTSTVLRETCA